MAEWAAHVHMLTEGQLTASEQRPRHARRNAPCRGRHAWSTSSGIAPISLDTSHLTWQRHAACVGVDPDAFFPDGPVDSRVLNICRTCPVFAECLNHALDDSGLRGIWAGTTDEQRKRMRAKIARLTA